MVQAVSGWLERVPIPALRDVVCKRPSAGPNVDVLDGIRGLAILFVLASHTGAFGQRGHGAVGVWLFFSLSAFLLTLPFARDPAATLRPSGLWRYTRRRLQRILPAYYLLLLIWYLATELGPAPFVAHLLFVRGDVHLWSIPQEMLFYLLLPSFALLHVWVFRSRAAASAVAMAVLAVVASLYLGTDLFSFQSNGRPQRFLLGVFLSGVTAAFAYSEPRLMRFLETPHVRRAMQPVGFAILAAMLLTAPDIQARLAGIQIFSALHGPLAWHHPGAYGAASGLLVFIVMLCRGQLLGRVLAWVPLRALGIVSYGLYLFHVAVALALRGWGVPPGIELFALTLLATYILAIVSYAVVERPIMRMR